MNNKTKITFVTTERFQKEMRTKIMDDGYSMRQKSTWVSSAIEAFLTYDNYIELVKLSENMHGFEKVETILVSKELKSKLDDAIVNVRKTYPKSEGVQSGIIRASILQQILRS